MKVVSGIALTLFLTSVVVMAFNTLHAVEATEVNLNTILLDKFDEYLAWLTRYNDLNGTTVDLQDYSDPTVVSVSTPMILYTLTYLYEQTSNEYYLSFLRTLIDGVIANTDNYVDVDGIGEIFYAQCLVSGGIPSFDTVIMNTANVGYACTKLWGWTGETSYKTIADRIADESLNKLSAINNSTDLAWSCAYYRIRDETGAKGAINRQSSMAVFYAEYGKNINSSFCDYVQKIIHWCWLAQLDYGGLAYGIGLTGVNYAYTAYTVFNAIDAYRVNSSIYDATTKEKIANATSFLTTQRACLYSYQTCFMYGGAFGRAWGESYFADYINVTNTKAIIFNNLQSCHFSNVGFRGGLGLSNYGFRWSQHFLSCFFAIYPLPTSSFDVDSEGMGFWVKNYGTGTYQFQGWMGEIIATDLDSWRDGANGYGPHIKSSNFQLHWADGHQGMVGLSAVGENRTHYLKAIFNHTVQNFNVTAYTYPISLFVGDIEGTNRPAEFYVTNTNNWRVAVENGTSWQMNQLSSGSHYNFGTHVLVYTNNTKKRERLSIMAKAENSTWGFVLSGVQYLNVTCATNHRVIYYVLSGWGPEQSACITTQQECFDALKSIVDDLDVVQPLAYQNMWDTYHDKITELQPDADWLTLYSSAQQDDEVKLIGHNLISDAGTYTYISAWDYTQDHLDFTVVGGTGTTSTVKFYCGSQGEPTTITGATSWSYDASTKICTIKATHSSDVDIEVDWLDGVYVLSIYVKTGNLAVANVNVTIEDTTKQTNLFGTCTFELPPGHYEVTASYGDKTRTKKTQLKQDKTIRINLPQKRAQPHKGKNHSMHV